MNGSRVVEGPFYPQNDTYDENLDDSDYNTGWEDNATFSELR